MKKTLPPPRTEEERLFRETLAELMDCFIQAEKLSLANEPFDVRVKEIIYSDIEIMHKFIIYMVCACGCMLDDIEALESAIDVSQVENARRKKRR